MAKRDKGDETGPPGAGTLFVYGGPAPDATVWDALPHTRPVFLASPDALLSRGIADYTYLPASEGGVLGRGKFSTVYRVRAGPGSSSSPASGMQSPTPTSASVASAAASFSLQQGLAMTTGPKYFALKHTPLHPHHPLIAARLLREPTLLAQLAPHPCLIGVDGFVRTEGHFYLVEECASTHVPLPQHPAPVAPSRAAKILDQLVSVMRDGLHAGRVCHRDLKGDNVLVDVATGDILLLDLGLATHFSASEPKLTTCCGSPAFHSPEIVHALNRRPGEVTYYGPELDIWCIALTMLSLLLQQRFPLGPTHTSRTVMGERAAERLAELDELYPPASPWYALGPHAWTMTEEDRVNEEEAWVRVRRAMRAFTAIDGRRRMAAFAAYDVGDEMRARVAAHAASHKGGNFKTTTFLPADIKYTLPLFLEPEPEWDANTEHPPIVLRNPSGEPERRIISYIKYLLRSAGILYHHVPDVHPTVLQLVLPLGPPVTEPTPAPTPRPPDSPNWVSTFLGLRKPPVRSASVPPLTTRPEAPTPSAGPARSKKGWAQQAWLRIEVERPPHASRSTSRAPSRSGPDSRTTSRAPSRAPSRPPSRTRKVSSRGTSRPGSRSRAVSGTAEDLRSSELSEITKQLRHAFPVPPPLARAQSEAIIPVRKHSLAETTSSGSGSGILNGNGLVTSPGSTTAAPKPRAIQFSNPAYATAPRVTLTLTEPRGYALVRSALSAAVPTPTLSSGTTSPSPVTRALAIPMSSGSSAANSDNDDEPERGRPRSKDTPPDRDQRSLTARPHAKKLHGEGTPGGTPRGTPRLTKDGRERDGERERERKRDDKGKKKATPTQSEPLWPPTITDVPQRRQQNRRHVEHHEHGSSHRGENHEQRDPKPSGLLESLFGKAGASAALAPSAERRSASTPPPRNMMRE